MERNILKLLWLVLFATVLVLGILYGLIVVRWLFPQHSVAPLENRTPKGSVAGSSMYETENAQVERSLPTPASTITPSAIVPSISTTPPTTTIVSHTSIPTLTTEPLLGLENGNFSEGFAHWQTRGLVKILPLSAPDQSEIFVDTEHFARLSSNTSLDWLGAHSLEQTFRVPPNHTALEFWYRIHTEETEPGFDSPCFVAFVNQQAVAWFSAAEASESWRSFAVPLPITNQPVTISFIVGQTGDQEKATWVDVTNSYTLEKLPWQDLQPSLALEVPLKLSFVGNASIGLSSIPETEVDLPQFTQKLHSELLTPELGFQSILENLPWRPDGESFQPELQGPDFYSATAAIYAADSENPWNLPTQLNQLKDQRENAPIKLWLTLKTALNEVLQLLPVEY